VVAPYINYNWQVIIGDYGVTTNVRRGDNEGKLASYTWDPPIKDMRRDFDMLHFRSCVVDREKTQAWKTTLEEVFAGVLPVRRRGGYWWTMGLTWPAIELVGLERFMVLMYDDPQSLHRLMAFLRDDHLAVIEWFETQGLLALNNEDDYIGSGSIGYTRELPQADFQQRGPVRLKDLWVLSESQETVGVSPEMFAEFVFPYQLPIIEKFGLSYYGCCEPVDARWDTLKQIPNLRRVSVAPWCDQRRMAEALGTEYVFCRKPNPSLISTQRFDEDTIRRDLRDTLRVARNCRVELVMKDVHTLADQPHRLGRWVQIAREQITSM